MAEGISSRWPWIAAIGVVVVAIIVVIAMWGGDKVSPPGGQEAQQGQTAGQTTGQGTTQSGTTASGGQTTGGQQQEQASTAPPPPKPLPEGAKVVEILTQIGKDAAKDEAVQSPTGGKVETVVIKPQTTTGGQTQTAQTQSAQTSPTQTAQGGTTAPAQGEKPQPAQLPELKGKVKKVVKDAQGNVKVVWVNPDGSIDTTAPQAPAGQEAPVKAEAPQAQPAKTAQQTASGASQAEQALTAAQKTEVPSTQSQQTASAEVQKAPATSGQATQTTSKPASQAKVKNRVVWAKPKITTKREGGEVPRPNAILEARKKPYGIQKSLDVVVRSDEIIELAGVQIPVAELERQMVVEQRGEVLEKPLGRPAQISAWGLYLVRKGDHLWGVHYELLSEYLASKGVELEPHADRPLPDGRSSGVGKILKFAENMVGVYNVKTGAMDENLDMIEPGEKVVVYNLTEIFEQLSKIDPHDLGGIEYDGRVLFFPKTKQGIKAPGANNRS